MIFLTNVFTNSLNEVWHTFSVNWIFLLLSAVIAALLKLYSNPARLSAFLERYRKVGVLAATGAAVATPLCSCGTVAIILGMLAGRMPWAPIVAFMVASPLTSPEELIYSAGLFGWPFALAFFGASIVLGLLGGAVADFADKRGWLEGQTRLAWNDPEPAPAWFGPIGQPAAACCAASAVPAAATIPTPVFSATAGGPAATITAASATVSAMSAPSCCGAAGSQAKLPAGSDTQATETRSAGRPSLQDFLNEVWYTGTRLLMMFLVFAFVGYFLNGLIPSAWVTAIFGQGNIYSVPLAATLGLPFYINTEASLPLVRAMLDSGMSQGAALAFLITGAGTSIGALTGMLTIARWRVVGIVVGTLWVGGILIGFGYNLFLFG